MVPDVDHPFIPTPLSPPSVPSRFKPSHTPFPSFLFHPSPSPLPAPPEEFSQGNPLFPPPPYLPQFDRGKDLNILGPSSAPNKIPSKGKEKKKEKVSSNFQHAATSQRVETKPCFAWGHEKELVIRFFQKPKCSHL